MKMFPLLLIGLTVSTCICPAAVVVSLSGVSAVNTTLNAPTENVFASTENTAVNSALGWRWDTSITPVSEREVAQSFFSGSSAVTFDKITFKIGGAAIPSQLKDNASAGFTFSIYEVASASALPSSGSLVSSQTGSFANFASSSATSSGNITGTAFNYITFDFADVQLDAGKYYAVVLAFDQSGSGYNVALGNNGNNSYYTGGTGAVAENGGSWAGTNDFYFYAQAVPEPGTAGAVLGAGLLFCVARFVRRAKAAGRGIE